MTNEPARAGEAEDPTGVFQPPSLSNHIPYLDGLRGIAVFLVMFVHFPFTMGIPFIGLTAAHGYFGVDIFSVLSGFVVYVSYSRKVIEAAKPLSKLSFILHRFFRIYSLALPFAIIIFFHQTFVAKAPALGVLALQLKAFGLFSFNEILNAPYWSLFNELYFYLLSPFLLYPLFSESAWRYTKWLALPLMCFFIAWYYAFVQSLPLNMHNLAYLRLHGLDIHVARGFLIKDLWPQQFSGSGFERMLFEFVMGIFAAKFFLTRRLNIPFLSSWLAVAILVSFFCGMWDTDIYTIALLVCWMAVGREPDFLRKFMCVPPLLFLGRISFSLYFIHTKVICVLRDALAPTWKSLELWQKFAWEGTYLAICILLALITYHLFERFWIYKRISHFFQWLSQKLFKSHHTA